MIVLLQNETARGPSVSEMPRWILDHCRSASMKVISVIETLN